MKKRTAILVFGAMLCCIGGYVAWCFWPFSQRPRLEFDSSVSDEGRKAAKLWKATASYPEPAEFEWSRAVGYLRDPWGPKQSPPVIIEEEAGCGLWAIVYGEVWAFPKAGGEWSSPLKVEHMGFVGSVQGDIKYQGAVATLLENVGVAEESTLEFLRLDPPPGVVASIGGDDESLPEPRREMFHENPIIARTMMLDRQERKELVEALARSIRSVAEVRAGFVAKVDEPTFGLIFRQGDRRVDFKVSPENQSVGVYGNGVEIAYDLLEGEGVSSALIGTSVQPALDAIVDKYGLKRVEEE